MVTINQPYTVGSGPRGSAARKVSFQSGTILQSGLHETSRALELVFSCKIQSDLSNSFPLDHGQT